MLPSSRGARNFRSTEGIDRADAGGIYLSRSKGDQGMKDAVRARAGGTEGRSVRVEEEGEEGSTVDSPTKLFSPLARGKAKSVD